MAGPKPELWVVLIGSLFLLIARASGSRFRDTSGLGSRGEAGWLTQDPKWINQTLDHFSPTPSRTFRQRYYEHLPHFSPVAGPVFLLICGEAECRGVRNDYAAVLARTFGGALVALEHRYYGESTPFEDQSTENLRFLSSKQALGDLAAFRSYYQGVLNQRFDRDRSSEDNPWISIGISYAGALSAFFRLKYPHLVKGAVASSGVVHAILDYTAFDTQVAASAGPECAEVLRQVTGLVEEGLRVNATRVKALFRAEKLTNDGDFLYLLADAAAEAVQYGHPAALCTPLLAAKVAQRDLLATYADYVTSFFYERFKVDPLSYSQEYLRNVRAPPEESASRLWWYQVCTEFAFFQTAPVKGSIRSQQVDLRYHKSLCENVFGSGVLPDVEATNRYYGGEHVAGRRIYFSNGSQDPWRHASKLHSAPGEPVYVMHCDNCGHGTDFRGCPQVPAQEEGDVSKCASPSAVEEVRKAMVHHLHHWMRRENELEGSSTSIQGLKASS